MKSWKFLISGILLQIALTPFIISGSFQPLSAQETVEKMVLIDRFRAANPGRYLTDFEGTVDFSNIPGGACQKMIVAGNDFSHGLRVSMAVNGIPTDQKSACTPDQNRITYLWIEHDI